MAQDKNKSYYVINTTSLSDLQDEVEQLELHGFSVSGSLTVVSHDNKLLYFQPMQQCEAVQKTMKTLMPILEESLQEKSRKQIDLALYPVNP